MSSRSLPISRPRRATARPTEILHRVEMQVVPRRPPCQLEPQPRNTRNVSRSRASFSLSGASTVATQSQVATSIGAETRSTRTSPGSVAEITVGSAASAISRYAAGGLRLPCERRKPSTPPAIVPIATFGEFGRVCANRRLSPRHRPPRRDTPATPSHHGGDEERGSSAPRGEVPPAKLVALCARVRVPHHQRGMVPPKRVTDGSEIPHRYRWSCSAVRTSRTRRPRNWGGPPPASRSSS